MKLLPKKKIRTKFLFPILLLQLIGLGVLGFIGYHFSSNLLRNQVEDEFRMTIDSIYVSMESELEGRLVRIRQLLGEDVFKKAASSPEGKTAADIEVFDFQKANGLTLGEPEIGGLVNFSIGDLPDEGNKRVLAMGIFPSFEYVTPDGMVREHVYLGGSGNRDFLQDNSSKLERKGTDWFGSAIAGNTFVGIPRKMDLYLRTYFPGSEGKETTIDEDLVPIAIPDRRDGKITGVFMVTTTPDFMKSALEDIDTKSLLLLLDSRGETVAERGDLSLLSKLPRDFVKRTIAVTEGKIADIGRYIVMNQTIPAAGWRVLMIGDSDALYDSVFKLRNNTILIMLVSLAVMAAFIFAVIRRLLAPVLKLTKASDRIANGELGVVIRNESEDELGNLTDSFNQMSTRTKTMHDELEEKNVRLSRMNFVRRQLLSIISHELRTPLSAVVGFYELMEDEMKDITNEELIDLFRSMGGSIDRCKALVERLTRASAAIAEQIRSDDEAVESTNLYDAIRITCDAISRDAEARGISISYPNEANINVACPATAVKVLLEEALSNAVKYSPDGEKVVISVSRSDDVAKISIEDRGSGIPREYIHTVVEPFFEVQDANFHSTGRFNSMAGGLGLGLTIIMSILRQYHGRLDIQSPDAGGAVITMSLPIV